MGLIGCVVQELRGDVWQHPGSVVCCVNGAVLGDEKQLRSWAEKQWTFTFYRPQALYTALAQECYTKHLHSTGVSTLALKPRPEKPKGKE